MHFIDEKIIHYAEKYTTAHAALLDELENETWKKCLMPRMISGKLQGRLLSFLSRLKKPCRALEIGTFTGYSAICLSEGLSADGLLITIEKNEEFLPIIEKYLKKAALTEKVQVKIGDAAHLIPSLDGPFDLVFIDADKENYPLYLHLLKQKISEGGLIIADNVLWSGKVLQPDKNDAETMALIEYAETIHNDPNFITVMLPVRDGLMLSMKVNNSH